MTIVLQGRRCKLVHDGHKPVRVLDDDKLIDLRCPSFRCTVHGHKFRATEASTLAQVQRARTRDDCLVLRPSIVRVSPEGLVTSKAFEAVAGNAVQTASLRGAASAWEGRFLNHGVSWLQQVEHWFTGVGKALASIDAQTPSATTANNLAIQFAEAQKITRVCTRPHAYSLHPS